MSPDSIEALRLILFSLVGVFAIVSLTIHLASITYVLWSKKVQLKGWERIALCVGIVLFSISIFMLIPTISNFLGTDSTIVDAYNKAPFLYSYTILKSLILFSYVLFPLFFFTRLAWNNSIPVGIRYLIIFGFFIALVPLIGIGSVYFFEQEIFREKICLGLSCQGYMVIPK